MATANELIETLITQTNNDEIVWESDGSLNIETKKDGFAYSVVWNDGLKFMVLTISRIYEDTSGVSPEDLTARSMIYPRGSQAFDSMISLIELALDKRNVDILTDAKDSLEPAS